MPSAEDMLRTFDNVFTLHEKAEIRGATGAGGGLDDDAKEAGPTGVRRVYQGCTRGV
jgi:hypothetical protein